ncbi:MAG: prepilin-type N-terminal cleavage/methylation domain-containing protein [Verrucomicrobiota bacterium]|nr:prepilin-type N-terminal cleavage/methylation domain-containing protein [Verrucomicrobiota bacterium]
MNRKNRKGFTLVEIMIVVVIIGLLAAMAIPAFQKVRKTSQAKTVTNNLRQLANPSQTYMMEEGAVQVVQSDIVGPESTKALVQLPKTVAGEQYANVFPIMLATTQISVSLSDGTVVQYNF